MQAPPPKPKRQNPAQKLMQEIQHEGQNNFYKIYTLYMPYFSIILNIVSLNLEFIFL